MIKVAVVDDKRMLRNNLVSEIRYAQGMEVVLEAVNGVDFLEKIKKMTAASLPDIVMMDIDMPEKNGIEAVRDGKLLYPNVEFLMLTVFDDDEKIFEAIKAGASGYLLKEESPMTIMHHIQQVKKYKTVPMSPAIARKALRFLSNQSPSADSSSSREYGLTTREKMVLKGLVEGLNYKEMAVKLEVSPHTVRNQISSIYKKLYVKNKTEAVKLAIKRRIV